MPKTKISEWSSTPANNTDIDSINIAEGCAPSGINDAIRELMAQVKDLYSGTTGDVISVAGGGTGIGTLTGLVKGNGTSAFSAATAGTDYVTPTGTETLTNKTLTAPVMTAPVLGTPTSGVVTNLTGTASININGTVGATTPAAGAFTSLTASTTLGVTGVSTLTGGAVVQGLTVGKGAGAVATNVALGAGALQSSNSGNGNNIAIGSEAGRNNTTGAYNTWVGGLDYSGGLAVGRNNTTGQYNCGFGAGALASNTTASGSTAVGYQAGYSTTTGANQTFLGYKAGYNSTGFNNVIIGADAGSNAALSGNDNVLVGQGSGIALTSGARNTFVGGGYYGVVQGSGSAITTGSANTILGHYTGSAAPISATGSNFVVLSDGDGNIVASTKTAQTFALQGGTLSSGTGIAFPATQSASSDANTLDDYEEGTWTPTLAFGGNSVGITYTTSYNTASYTKIGSRVLVSGITLLSNKGSSTGNATLINLPFPPDGIKAFSAVTCSLSGVTFTGQYALELDANNDYIGFYQVTALGVQSALTNTNFSNSSAFVFSFSYYTT